MSNEFFSSHKSSFSSEIITLPPEVYSSSSENEIVLQNEPLTPHLIKSRSTNQKDKKCRRSLQLKHPKYHKTLPLCHNVLQLLSHKIDEFWKYRQEEIIEKKKQIEFEKSIFDLDEVSDFELN